MNDSLAQLDQELNYTLSLNQYYSSLAPSTITVNNITVPGWTTLTLQQLMSYRVSSFLSSKTISFNETSTNYYVSINQALKLGLVTLQDLQLVPLSNKILSDKDYPAVRVLNGADTNQTFYYQHSNYTFTEQGQTGKVLTLTEPSFGSQFSSVLNNSLYDHYLQNYGSGLNVIITTSPNVIPDTLITRQNYEMGLLYYSNSKLVSYNVTIPHDYWSYDANGSLIYITNNTVETKTYYQPVSGNWTDNYTFVPDQTVLRGQWIWNTTVMPRPDAYNITLAIPNYEADHQTFSIERVQGDTITFKTTLPVQAKRSYNLNVTISQLSAIGKMMNGTKTDEVKLASLYNKTAIFDNQTYYFANGVIHFTLVSNGVPTGGVVVNQSVLKQMAQVPTYNYSTNYVTLPNVNYTLTETVPDIVLVRYNPFDYPGELLLSRSLDTNQSYLVNLLEGKDLQLQEQNKVFPSYEYSLDTGLTTTTNDPDVGYIILQKRPTTEGFQYNILSQIVSQSLSTNTNDFVNLRLSSYKMINNPDSAIYKEYAPLINYNYANDTFTQMLHTIEQFNTFFTPIVRDEVLTNISNNLMSFCWSWYNSTSGFFRNDVKETASVINLYSILQRYLKPENKFYFYDQLTGLNTTVNKYTYSKLENTTKETNVVSTRLSYSATSNEPTVFGRSLDVLSILRGLYAYYDPYEQMIYNNLTAQSFTTARQVQDYINSTWGQTHQMGRQLYQSVVIIQHQEYLNTNSTALQQQITTMAQENAQRKVYLEDLFNDPALRYELYQSGTNFHSVQDSMLLLQQMGLNPSLAIQAHAASTFQDRIFSIHDNFIQLLHIMNMQQKASPMQAPVTNFLTMDSNIKGVLARLSLLVSLFPLLYGIWFLPPKGLLLIFGLYAMVSMVLEIGAQSLQNKISLSSTLITNLFTNDMFGVALKDIQNMAQNHLLDHYFVKPLEDGYRQVMNPGMVRTSTQMMVSLTDKSVTTLTAQYQNYISQLNTQRAIYNKQLYSVGTTMTIGDGSWIQQVTYRDWVLSNYQNMLKYRMSYEQGKETAIVQAQYTKKMQQNEVAYNQLMAESSIKTKSNKIGAASSLGSASGIISSEDAGALTDTVTKTDFVRSLVDTLTKSMTTLSEDNNIALTKIVDEMQYNYNIEMSAPGDHTAVITLPPMEIGGILYDKITVPISKSDLESFKTFLSGTMTSQDTGFQKTLTSFLYTLLSAVNNNTLSNGVQLSTETATLTNELSRVIDYIGTGMNWKQAMFQVIYEDNGQMGTSGTSFGTFIVNELQNYLNINTGTDPVIHSEINQFIADVNTGNVKAAFTNDSLDIIPTLLKDNAGNEDYIIEDTSSGAGCGGFGGSSVKITSCNLSSRLNLKAQKSAEDAKLLVEQRTNEGIDQTIADNNGLTDPIKNILINYFNNGNLPKKVIGFLTKIKALLHIQITSGSAGEAHALSPEELRTAMLPIINNRFNIAIVLYDGNPNVKTAYLAIDTAQMVRDALDNLINNPDQNIIHSVQMIFNSHLNDTDLITNLAQFFDIPVNRNNIAWELQQEDTVNPQASGVSLIQEIKDIITTQEVVQENVLPQNILPQNDFLDVNVEIQQPLAHQQIDNLPAFVDILNAGQNPPNLAQELGSA